MKRERHTGKTRSNYIGRMTIALERIAKALEEQGPDLQAFMDGVAEHQRKADARAQANHEEVMRQQKEWMDQQAVVRQLDRPSGRMQ